MLIILYILGGIAVAYLLFTLLLTYLVHQMPREPISDEPDWGRITDTTIPTIDGGFLEVWRIEPDGVPNGIIVFAHGWGRNRDRMVERARIFAHWGFTTVIHSSRDHGGSSPYRLVNALTMAEDIEALLGWINEPVMLYGHSAGAAAAIIAAGRQPHAIRLLFLEACYADTKEGLLSLYRWFNRFLGIFFGPAILFWMELFYKGEIADLSPTRIAPTLPMPVMLIHGEKDKRFPLAFALKLKRSFKTERVKLYVAEGAGHSDSSQTPGYIDTVKSFLDHHLKQDGILE